MKIRIAVLLLVVLISSFSLAQDSSRTVITAGNISSLDMLIRLGRGGANAVAWSPDGSTILVGSTVGVWKYDAAALDTQTEPQLIETTGEVYDIAVSPDGSTLMVSHNDGDGMTSFNLSDDSLIQSIELEKGNAQKLAFNTTGNYISVNHGSSGVLVYDFSGNAVYDSAAASLDSDVRVLISPNDGKLVAASSNYGILVWDFAAGGDPATLTGHTSSIEDMTISPDGTLLVSGSSDDSFIVWDLTTNEMIEQYQMPDTDYSNRDVYAVAFSPDGKTLLTGHGAKVRFWNVSDFTMSSEIEVVGTVKDIAYSPDGSQFVVLSGSHPNAVQLYKADGTAVATSNFHNNSIDAVTFSPDSAVLAFNDTDKNLYLWDTETAQEITFATKVAGGASFSLDNKSNLTYSSDGRYLATLQSFSAELRDPVNGTLIRAFDDVSGIAEDIEFSPDNTLLAFITSQGFYIFDVETGERLVYFDHANDWMNDVTWSPDQTMIATASGDHAVRVYTIR